MLKSNIQWTSKLNYPWVVAPFCDGHHFTCKFLQKNSIDLDSRLRTVAYKIKLLLVKQFHIK